MKMTKANGYVKTNYEVMMRMSTYYAIYRTVYQKDDKYYVSYDGEICDVTYRKDCFRYKY